MDNAAIFQILNESFDLVQPVPSNITHELLCDLYYRMLFIRTFDQRSANLQKAGKIGNYPSALGQEAIRAAIAATMSPKDILFPTYRDQAILTQRGLPIARSLSWWAGDERGNVFEEPYKDFPPCIPIATQCLLATGAAYSIKYNKEEKVVVVTLGDGATSKGDFYEAMNLAGVWQLPIVFVICNNQWAISVPLNKQTACKTLAQKSIAAGLPALQVDGNDAIALYHVLSEAILKTRQQQRSVVIEAITYRLCDHTTSDDGKRYRSEEEVKQAWQKEPLLRLRNFLTSHHILSTEKEEAMKNDIRDKIEKGVQEFLNLPQQPATAMFDYLYDSLPLSLMDQYEEVRGAQ